MKFLTSTAIALGAIAVTAPASAQYAPQVATPAPQAPARPAESQAQPAAPAGAIKLSRKASKAIVALQKAVNENKTAEIPALLEAAKAVAETPEDKYATGQLQLRVALAAKDTEAAVKAVEYMAASTYLPKATVAGLYNQLGVEFYNAKNRTRATQLFQTALSIDPSNAEAQRLLAESQMSADPKAAVATMKKAIEQAAATGQKLPEDSYKRAVKAAYDARSTDAVSISRAWIAAYPSAESWHNGVAIYRNMMQPGVTGTLDLLRLLRAAGALQTSGDYTLFATAASEQGNFGEAQSVIDEGLANKKVDPKAKLARDIINGLKDKPKPSAAELESAAAAAKTANAMNAVGNRFYGLGNYARAAELYRKAAAAGGDANLANLHLGMALARAGDKAGAIAALKSVTGEYAPIAAYWLIYAGG